MANTKTDAELVGRRRSKNESYEEKNFAASASESFRDDIPPQSPTDQTLARKLSARQVQMIAIGGEY